MKRKTRLNSSMSYTGFTGKQFEARSTSNLNRTSHVNMYQPNNNSRLTN